MRSAFAGLVAGLVLLVAGGVVLAISATNYLASPTPMNSAVGLPVFTVNGVLVQYEPWRPGAESTLLACGVVAIVASLVAAAARWRPRESAD